MARILVTGGTGFIGSHVNFLLYEAGHDCVVFDNLSRSFPQPEQLGQLVEGDLSNRDVVERLFERHDFDAVMHFAGLIDVGESFSLPSDYYTQNVSHTITLLDAMRRHGVMNLVFSSSAAIFGLPQTELVGEEHQRDPLSPYGHSKLMVETLLKDFEDAYGLRSACLRYFNAAGGDPNGVIKNCKRSEHNLIPRLLRSLLQDDVQFQLNGTDYATPDGTCIRDYIHVFDLGQAHLLAMDHLLADGPSCAFNLGNGMGYSIRQVIDAVRKVTGKELSVKEGPRRRGDPDRLVARSEHIEQELGWKQQYPQLEQMIEDAWRALH